MLTCRGGCEARDRSSARFYGARRIMRLPRPPGVRSSAVNCIPTHVHSKPRDTASQAHPACDQLKMRLQILHRRSGSSALIRLLSMRRPQGQQLGAFPLHAIGPNARVLTLTACGIAAVPEDIAAVAPCLEEVSACRGKRPTPTSAPHASADGARAACVRLWDTSRAMRQTVTPAAGVSGGECHPGCYAALHAAAAAARRPRLQPHFSAACGRGTATRHRQAFGALATALLPHLRLGTAYRWLATTRKHHGERASNPRRQRTGIPAPDAPPAVLPSPERPTTLHHFARAASAALYKVQGKERPGPAAGACRQLRGLAGPQPQRPVRHQRRGRCAAAAPAAALPRPQGAGWALPNAHPAACARAAAPNAARAQHGVKTLHKPRGA